MTYWLNLFTGKTWKEFRAAGAKLTGFREHNRARSKRIRTGDAFVCYLVGVKRWVGLLEIQSEAFHDETPIYEEEVFPVRFKVNPLVTLDPEHGVPMESLAGKSSALRGKVVDGSAFVGEKVNDLKEILEKYGFKSTGKEVMYDGRTGKKFNAEVYVGVVYYQKLHHMVADKIHSRARGQVQMLTKQPTEGRARGGGLRFGEMERDCLIAYGASMMLKDRLLEESDKAEVNICERCGLLAYYDIKQRRYVCRVCGDRAKISSVAIAYAFKLLLQEMISLNVAPRLIPKEKV